MNKFWTDNYPCGVAKEVTIPDTTIVDLVDNVCKDFTNCKSFTCNDVSLTFGDVGTLITNLASSLYELGVRKGDKVAVIMPNIMQYPIIIFAILKLGAVVVNINPLYTPDEMEYIISNASVKMAIVLNMMAHKLNNIVKLYKLNVIVTKIPDPYPSFIKRGIINFVIEKIKKTKVDYSYQAIAFRKLLTNKAPLVYNPNLVNTDLAFIQYTGATTGKPKGAMLSHRNIVANITQIHNWLAPQVGNLSGQVVIDALPLYHIFSLTANLFTFFFGGSENVMIPNPKDIHATVKVLKKSNFTVFSALDTLYNHLLSSEEFKSQRYPFFKYSVAGGMPARSSVAHEWYQVTGVMPSNCYGMTEASPAVTMNTFDNSFDGSVGFPVPNTELEIRHVETQELLPINTPGIIWVRGPQVMSGYWDNPSQTEKVMDVHGWFNTGDIGYLNEKGKLFISGRSNDMIIVSGFNVYPVEVENVLDTFTDIKESAVIGVKDSGTGEKVVAFVVFEADKFMVESEIIHNLRQKLTSYKIPKEIVIMDKPLPKTLVGKIDKVALGKFYTTNH